MYISTGGHDPPAYHTYIYIDNYTDQSLILLTTISCLLCDLYGSLVCAFRVPYRRDLAYKLQAEVYMKIWIISNEYAFY